MSEGCIKGRHWQYGAPCIGGELTNADSPKRLAHKDSRLVIAEALNVRQARSGVMPGAGSSRSAEEGYHYSSTRW